MKIFNFIIEHAAAAFELLGLSRFYELIRKVYYILESLVANWFAEKLKSFTKTPGNESVN